MDSAINSVVVKSAGLREIRIPGLGPGILYKSFKLSELFLSFFIK